VLGAVCTGNSADRDAESPVQTVRFNACLDKDLPLRAGPAISPLTRFQSTGTFHARLSVVREDKRVNQESVDHQFGGRLVCRTAGLPTGIFPGAGIDTSGARDTQTGSCPRSSWTAGTVENTVTDTSHNQESLEAQGG